VSAQIFLGGSVGADDGAGVFGSTSASSATNDPTAVAPTRSETLLSTAFSLSFSVNDPSAKDLIKSFTTWL
jgi:hypothetical protein